MPFAALPPFSVRWPRSPCSPSVRPRTRPRPPTRRGEGIGSASATTARLGLDVRLLNSTVDIPVDVALNSIQAPGDKDGSLLTATVAGSAAVRWRWSTPSSAAATPPPTAAARTRWWTWSTPG
ncbi:hypothetical protein GXW82_41910 [Streptacidiphilus sp. 4-A2]|nr:hypothetical protein [Streptacidiphilus sp. 4-A2]